MMFTFCLHFQINNALHVVHCFMFSIRSAAIRYMIPSKPTCTHLLFCSTSACSKMFNKTCLLFHRKIRNEVVEGNVFKSVYIANFGNHAEFVIDCQTLPNSAISRTNSSVTTTPNDSCLDYRFYQLIHFTRS